MDEELQKIVDGLTPQMVANKSQEFHKEFLDLVEIEKLTAETFEETWDEAREQMLFRSFICHKVAAISIVLDYVVKHLNENESDMRKG